MNNYGGESVIEGILPRKEVILEKVFALSGSKIIPTVARYHTLQWGANKDEVEYIFLNKKYEWANRAKEEVKRCFKCKSFILPKDQKAHKLLCKPQRVEPVIETLQEERNI